MEREFWQSAGDAARTRQVVRRGGTVYELVGDSIYDSGADTIYEPESGKGLTPPAGAKSDAGMSEADKAKAAKLAQAGRLLKVVPAGAPNRDSAEEPPGGPIVNKVRSLLAGGRAEVRGRERHDGQAAWAIGLQPGLARPGWTLWVSAADGRPLALHDPGGLDATWSVYEVQPGDDAAARLTLTGAHPGAHVVRDNAQYAAAQQRLQANVR